MSPKISIIVPIYKVEQYLNKCINSILKQTFIDFELLLIDDGSPDRCGEICDGYAIIDHRIKVIHKNNGGLSDSRNFGLNIACGEYLCFVDSDDYIAANMLEVLINTAIKYNSNIVFFDNYRVYADDKIISNPLFDKLKIFDTKDAMKYILCDIIGSQVWSKFYNTSLFNNIRFPIGRYYEDIPTTYKVISKSNKVVYINECLYFYRIREGSISNIVNPLNIYHIFLGFSERSEYAKCNFPELVSKCIYLAINSGLIAYPYFEINKNIDKNKIIANEIYKYIQTNKYLISKSEKMFIKEKIKLFILNNRYLFYIILKIKINFKKIFVNFK